QFADLPVVIYTSKDLSRREEAQLKRYASAIITKTTGSAERLLEETSLFLHRVLKTPGVGNESQADGNHAEIQANTVRADSTASGQALAAKAPARKGKGKPKGKSAQAIETQMADGASSDAVELSGQTVLVVDDDMRNIFALTSVLESQGVNVVFAENGRDGIEVLQQNQDISIVLMDVMMPEMDGYETMQAIRRMEQYAQLPIIALTAKVLSGDREKCIEAGASDYIPKPVDITALLLMMRRLLSVAKAG
ncbi:MAG TPA: response regulator, partial [Abditibacteriaceae bacterium]